jgi:deoxycytidylate deaminase
VIINAGIVRVVYKEGYPDDFSLKLFEEAASEYNQATRGKMERINTREGVKNWIL